jgi:hypothetical protein
MEYKGGRKKNMEEGVWEGERGRFNKNKTKREGEESEIGGKLFKKNLKWKKEKARGRIKIEIEEGKRDWERGRIYLKNGKERVKRREGKNYFKKKREKERVRKR